MGLARSAWQGRPSPHLAIPIWVKHGIDAWMVAAKIEDRRLLRPLFQEREFDGDELGEWAIWSVVEQSAKEIRIEHLGHTICAGRARSFAARTEEIWSRSNFFSGTGQFKQRNATSVLNNSQLPDARGRKALHRIPEQTVTTCIPERLTIETQMVRAATNRSLENRQRFSELEDVLERYTPFASRDSSYMVAP
jgi:uncharacterized membrane protein